MTFKYLPYQEHGVAVLKDLEGRALLADEMGLGKTVQALGYIKEATEGVVVIVCPKSLKINWQREAQQHFAMQSVVLEGTTPTELAAGLPEGVRILIINYDILHAWVEVLKDLNPELLVCDEAHCLKTRSTRRTKAVKELSKGIPGCILISGTPVENRPDELWSLLHILFPEEYKHFAPFAKKYCRKRKVPGKKWSDYKGGGVNEKRLHHEIQPFTIRRKKDDVLKQLPDRRYTVTVLPLSDPEEYQRAQGDFLFWLRQKCRQAALRASRAEAITKMSYLKRMAAQQKMASMLDYFDRVLEVKQKIVISACQHETIGVLRDHFESKGIKAVKIDGRDSATKRQQVVDAFQGDPDVRVFIGQIDATNTGLTLTAATDVYFAELDWVPAKHAQMADRVHRIGQKNACTANFLVGQNTMEESMVKALQDKIRSIGKIIDGDEFTEGYDIYDQLLRELNDVS